MMENNPSSTPSTSSSVLSKMQELRFLCENDTVIGKQKADLFAASFARSLHSLNSKANHISLNQVKTGKLKAQLRAVEDELVKALAEKTRKEGKRMAISDSLSETRAKVKELQRIVQDQTSRKIDYATILSEQMNGSQEKSRQSIRRRKEIQEACTWYNRVLGLRIDGGHGVKFTFTNINHKCPTEEYSFTIRHSNNVYTLIDCNTLLNGTEELVNELNKSNALFKFVRIMREKFQAAALGSSSQFILEDQHTTSISISAPVSSYSTNSRCRSPVALQEANMNIQRVYQRQRERFKSDNVSPVSVTPPQRFPHVQVEKEQ